MTTVGGACDRCLHIHRELVDGWIPACDAFPQGIPDTVYYMHCYELQHCNNGIGFEKDPDTVFTGYPFDHDYEWDHDWWMVNDGWVVPSEAAPQWLKDDYDRYISALKDPNYMVRDGLGRLRLFNPIIYRMTQKERQELYDLNPFEMEQIR